MPETKNTLFNRSAPKASLSGSQPILDVVGHLVANVRQFEQFLLARGMGRPPPIAGIFELRLEDSRRSPYEAPAPICPCGRGWKA
jgi:hypothetical protein